MKNLNVKVFIYILLVLSTVFFFLFAYLSGLNISKLWDYLQILPRVAFADFIIYLIFIKWAWRWRIFQEWLVLFPDLNGTWQGYIQTNWRNPETGEIPGPISAILTIKQTFGRISCIMRTAEMTSYSFAEDFRIEKANQIRQLTYSYTSKPKSSILHRSPPHEGTIVFDIIGNPVLKLKGEYWTARKTTGEIILTFREKKILEDLPDDLSPHPMAK